MKNLYTTEILFVPNNVVIAMYASRVFAFVSCARIAHISRQTSQKIQICSTSSLYVYN